MNRVCTELEMRNMYKKMKSGLLFVLGTQCLLVLLDVIDMAFANIETSKKMNIVLYSDYGILVVSIFNFLLFRKIIKKLSYDKNNCE